MSTINANVVIKRDNKWYLAVIKEDKIRKGKNIKKLSDATAEADYITVKKYIKENKLKETSEDLLVKYKCTSLYFRVEEVKKTVKKTVKKVVKKEVKIEDILGKKSKEPVQMGNITVKEWWSKINKVCQGCIKKCKQSAYVDIIVCKTYSV